MNIQTEDKGNLTRYTKNMMISMHGMFKHPAEVVVEGEGDGGKDKFWYITCHYDDVLDEPAEVLHVPPLAVHLGDLQGGDLHIKCGI